MLLNRMSIKFGGQSGQGINTVGKLLAKSLSNSGYKIFAYREYPSLIKGGIASYQIDFSNKQINSSSKHSNILITFTPEALNEYLFTVSHNGIVIHDSKDLTMSDEQQEYINKNNIQLVFLDSVTVAKNTGGTEIMSNAVMLGFVWKILDLNIDILTDTVLQFFEKKNIDLEAEKKCILAGFNSPTYRPELSNSIDTPKISLFKSKQLTISGNAALSLGAISSGVRAYYAYPMTPATSIFQFLGNTSSETKILVKQAENEITAIQLALGSMYMGTRGLVATSGGGFDLMIETLTCAGISEVPLVVVLSQRAGPATGVPTWTGAGDLNTAVKSGHGEFPRCVISVSDANSSYTLIQQSFNIAETYQIPVILLTEKQISESLFSIDGLPKNIPIQRGLSDGDLRYQITQTGISPRWIPSKEKKPYLSNSDEHTEDATSTENSKEIVAMMEKRMRKMEELKKEIPSPIYFGPKDADTVFVGLGSSKNAIVDTIPTKEKTGYLHFEYIYPLKTDTLGKLIEQNKRLVLIENNQTGQLGNLIKEEIGYEFKEKLLKYDGRPFFVEDILDFLNQ